MLNIKDEPKCKASRKLSENKLWHKHEGCMTEKLAW
jgi:hypothetical protein